MMMKSVPKITKYMAGIFCAVAMSATQAASIEIAPTDNNLNSIGDMFTLDLIMDFSDAPTTGGAVDISWDQAIIQYKDDFAFNAAFTSRDTGFDTIDFQQPGLLSIGFGNFSTAITDTILIGTLGFTGLAEGTTDIDLQDSVKWAGFFDFNTGALIPVAYTGGTGAVVPLPAAVWLMISGLGMLGFSAKRKRRA
jgi:hypothetical protein